VTTEDTRRRNGRILMIVAAVLVLAIGGLGVYLLVSDDGTDDPNTAARTFVDVYQRGLNSSGRDVDIADFEPVVCAADMQQLREAFADKENLVEGAPQFRLSVKDLKTDGDNGSFTVATEITSPGDEEQTADENFTLVKEDGDWRVCGRGAF
jgi:hypothetical protein